MPKSVRRVGGVDDMINSLYATGKRIRDIQAHLARTMGTELFHERISKVTDAVLEEVPEWQTQPLEGLHPIIYVDAMVVKVRDGHQVRKQGRSHRRRCRSRRREARALHLGLGHLRGTQ